MDILADMEDAALDLETDPENGEPELGKMGQWRTNTIKPGSFQANHPLLQNVLHLL